MPVHTLDSRWKASLAGVLGCLLIAPTVWGQEPAPIMPGPTQFAQTPQTPGVTSDLTGQPSPYAPTVPEEGTAPPGGAAADSSAFGGYGSAFAPGQFGGGLGSTTAIADNVGYIDSAIIRSRLRVRYDSAYNLNAPDKAEFFYAKCGCFANPANFPNAIVNGAFNLKKAAQMGYDPRARGPQHPILPGKGIFGFGGDPRINYQELATYLEYAPVRNFSAFIEMPARFINPVLVKNNYGFSDMNLGFKYAFVAEPNAFYTFQFRTYVPTGASDRGLGTGHPTLEPALLVFQRLTDRLYLSGEFRDWIPIDGSNFAGNILRYGLGLTYNIILTAHFRVAPVNEVVGWTILGGKELVPSSPSTPINVAGQTIVNEKIGLRFGLGDYNQSGGGGALNDRHSLYVGYGQALTGDHWYKQDIRVEYNFWF